MTIYFKPYKNTRLKIVATLSDSFSEKEKLSMTFEVIKSYCNDHNRSSPYFRMWVEEKNGKDMTVVDFGSHSEFFYVAPPLNPRVDMHVMSQEVE